MEQLSTIMTKLMPYVRDLRIRLKRRKDYKFKLLPCLAFDRFFTYHHVFYKEIKIVLLVFLLIFNFSY